MDRHAWEAQRTSFGTAADLYDRVRPRYHEQAIRWALGTPDIRVADVGAGTGILTRQLMTMGYAVTPVEPDAGMRAWCDRALRELAGDAAPVARDGSAEAIPLPDGSVDAVVAGQAYHWFDPARALPEIARVLRPGGVFAPMWNIRDGSHQWVRELTAVLRGEDGTGLHAGWRGITVDHHFEAPERATFRFAARHTPDSLLDLLRSRSYYLTGSPEHRRTLEHDLRELLATHPDLAGRDEFDLPYVTVAYRARRKAG